MDNTAAQALTPAAACKPAYKRLTQDQLLAIVDLRKLGKTQAEIAQTLGCTQQAVSDWLRKTADSTEAASLYLRGQSLRMAKNVVQKGQARDHIQALKGIGVLADDHVGQGLVIQIGIKDSDVKINLSPSESGALERKATETLTISGGSDNAGYVE